MYNVKSVEVIEKITNEQFKIIERFPPGGFSQEVPPPPTGPLLNSFLPQIVSPLNRSRIMASYCPQEEEPQKKKEPQ